MLSLLLTALAVQAAPAIRQNSGYMITVAPNEEPGQNNPQLCLVTNFNGGTGGNSLGDGTEISFFPCSQAQTTSPTENMYGLWDIHYGDQAGIQLVGTNFCIDAGDNPDQATSVPGKVWTCYPGLPQQQMYYTGTNHIAVTGASICLDQSPLFGAFFELCGINGSPGYTMDIQAFGIMSANGGSSPTTPTMTTMTTATMPSPTEPGPNPTASSAPQLIFWQNAANDNSMCLTVTNGQFYDGSPVGIAPCPTGPNLPANQLWSYAADPLQPGVTNLQVGGQNYCVDFGIGGGYDGTPMKIWQCYPGLFQQTFYWTADFHIAVYNGNQCLDVEAGTNNVQSYQCSGPDVHQHWNQPLGVSNIEP